jgi:transglutaminase-like putative cysteine protease
LAEVGLRHALEGGIRRARRAEKFVILVLLFILLTVATASVSAVLTGPDWASLWESLLLGLLVGWLLAIFRWPAWRSALLVVVLGIFFCLIFSGGLNHKILAVSDEFFKLLWGSITTLKIKGNDFSPLSGAALGLLTSIGVVLMRVMTWLTDLLTGQANFDPVAAAIVWSFLVWLVAAWAGWIVEAGKNALAAALPALLLCLTTLSYVRNVSSSIYLLMGVTLVLIAIVAYDQREEVWNETKVAYPKLKGREVGNLSLVLSIILVALAAIISSISIQRISHLTAEMRGTTNQGESGLAKSLGIQPAATPSPDAFSTIRSPGLPRELLIGSGPELSKQVVMSVKVDDFSALPPVGQLPPFYWRSFTYDIYTGHGWSSSQTLQTQYQPDQLIQPEALPGHVLIQEQMSLLPIVGGTIYALGEPASVNVPSSAAWRSPNDLFGIQASDTSYSIQSLVPVATETALRAAGQDYPSWVVQRYLSVPSEVPARVKELAIQLTATEPTPYDRAHAIEQYLRQTYPYTLDVPRPPANQDLVDYFLFDLRKGYCDDYASAMVILARAAGIPARLAIGYASGTYNLNSRRYIVTQADAHSWVEVYFPGIGWVSFEPTAGLPAIDRSAQPTQPATLLPTQPVVIPKSTGAISFGKNSGLFLLMAAGLLLFTWIAWDEVKLSRLKQPEVTTEIYRRMKRYANHLGVPLEGGETPNEFSGVMVGRLSEISASGGMASAGLKAAEGVRSLIDDIVQLNYRPIKSGEPSKMNISTQWRALRWRLRWMWVLKIWGGLVHRPDAGFGSEAQDKPAQAG